MEHKIFETISSNPFWEEIKLMLPTIKYSLFGSSTIEIPSFHRENLKNIAENLPASEFQYDVFCLQLKESIVKYFPENILRREITKEEIIVTPGAIKSIHLILSTFLDIENDELIIFQPFYGSHITDLISRGFKNIRLANRKTDFSIDFDDLESKLNEKTRFLIITNPDNPTTHVHSEAEFRKLSDLLENFPKVLVIEDMAYFAYLSNEGKIKSFSSINNNKEKTFSVFSGGKLFNITGLRCGWTIGPKSYLSKVQKSIELNFAFTSPIESICIAENLKSSTKNFEEKENYYEWVKDDQNKRFDYVLNFLKDFSLKTIKPEGTYYLILDISCYRGKLAEKYFYTLDVHKKELDLAFCRMFMEEKIGVLPLSTNWDESEKNDYLIRISCNRKYEDLELLKNAFYKLKNEGKIF